MKKENKIYIKNKYGLKLCGILNEFDDNDTITVICHASGSHKDSRATFNIAKILNDNNINNFRFDFTSCGESEGRDQDMTMTKLYEDLESVLDYLLDEGYNYFILIGTSLGGRIISLVDIKQYNVKKIILWYPAIFYRNKLKLLKNKIFRKKEEIIAIKNGFYLLHGKKKVSLEYLEQERKINFFNNIIKLNIPMLIIHGNNDSFVNYCNSVYIAKKHNNAKLIIIEGENHGFKNKDENLTYACNETVSFIKGSEVK